MGGASSDRNLMHRVTCAMKEYNLSIQEHKVPCDAVLPQSSFHYLIWFDAEETPWNNTGQCLYVCDSGALDRLRVALTKVHVIDEGVAWPYVNVSCHFTFFQWFLMRQEMKETQPLITPVWQHKAWFTIAEDVKHLFEYTVALLQLTPIQKLATLQDVNSVGMKVHGNHQIPLNLVITHPGDVVMSLHPYCNCDNTKTVQPSVDQFSNFEPCHTDWESYQFYGHSKQSTVIDWKSDEVLWLGK